MPDPYHSAHDPQLSPEGLSGFSHTNGEAFVHDVMSADFLPDPYMKCDVLYADPPWRTGYQEFTQRCCIDDAPTYDTFMWHVVDLIDRSALPAVMIVGKQAAKYFDGWTATPTRLHRFDAIAYWRDVKPARALTATGIVEDLARQFECVGDFFAGYGAAARVFTAASKRFVASDCNPACISVIRDVVLKAERPQR